MLTARRAGADDFLAKPTDAVKFLTRITIAEGFLRMKAQLCESQPGAGRDASEPR